MKKNSKQQKNEARIAAEVIAEQIITNTKTPSPKAIMQRISSLTVAAAKQGPSSFGFALKQIDAAARAYWTTEATEARAIMYRVSSLTTVAAKHGPDSFGFALQQIEEAARGFWKQARA